MEQRLGMESQLLTFECTCIVRPHEHGSAYTNLLKEILEQIKLGNYNQHTQCKLEKAVV